MRNIRHCLIVIALLAMPASIYACLWDYDTLRQERSRFPSTLEVITGKFLRHSPEFYEWRVQDRTKKLEADPNNLAYLDDLAVAYHKLGQHDKAIEIMQRKDKISPNLYETEANISTFYFFAGDLQKSLFHVDKALAINPNAHFGREKYQKYLIEWILVKPYVSWWFEESKKSFANFLHHPEREPDLLDKLSKRKEAINAVLGMMRFADHKAPILLDALGSLLYVKDSDIQSDEHEVDAKKLAARAYVKASMEAKSETEKSNYRTKALASVYAFTLIRPRKPEGDESDLAEMQQHFQYEINDADSWYAKLREDEIRWISQGKDVDVEYDKKYYQAPRNETTEPSPILNDPDERLIAYVLIGVGIVFALILVAALLARRFHPNRRTTLLLQEDYGDPKPSSEGRQ